MRYDIRYALGNLGRSLLGVVIFTFLFGIIFGAGCAGLLPVQTLHAQSGDARASRVDPRTDPRIPVPSDTGRAITGYQTYVRYNAPSQCAQATQFLTSDLRAWSGLWHDTLPYAAQLDERHPAAVITEARRCVGHFTAANVASRELSSLLPLTVVIGDSIAARAVIDRQVVLAPNEAGKAAVLLAAMQVYLQARPVQLTSAAAVLARFDTVAPTRRLECAQGHMQLLAIAHRLFDVAWMRREIATMLPLMRSLSIAQRGTLINFYGAAKTLWYWEKGQDSGAVAMTALLKESPHAMSDAVHKQAGDAGLDGLGHAYMLSVGGLPAPPIPASFWSPSPGVTYPKRGQMTVVMWLGTRHFNGVPITTGAWVQLREYRAMLTRLHTKYSSHGLQFIFVLSPAGFTPPMAEADRFALTAKWFATQFPFPSIVGEQTVPFTTRPLPDGRRIYGKGVIEADSVYWELTNFPVKVIGPKGTFVWNQMVSLPDHEAELDAFIRQGLDMPPQQNIAR